MLTNALSMPKDVFSFLWVKKWHPRNVSALPNNSLSSFRKLLDAYIDELLKSEFQKRTNHSVSIMDIGGGSGYVRKLFAKNGFSGTYLGIDAVADNRFHENDVPQFQSMQKIIPIEQFVSDRKFDFVVSVTSLEHIQNDAMAADIAKKHIATGGMSFHIVPSSWTLPLYFLHGYRQYHASRLRKLFGTEAEIVSIGGLASFICLFFFFTIPERLVKAKTKWREWPSYSKWVNRAARLDRFMPIMPLAYITVLRGPLKK